MSNCQLRKKHSEEHGEEFQYGQKMRKSVYGDTVVQPLHVTDEETKTQRVPNSLFSGGKK